MKKEVIDVLGLTIDYVNASLEVLTHSSQCTHYLPVKKSGKRKRKSEKRFSGGRERLHWERMS